jgi:uncharacterized protein (DUF1800 family)
LVERLVWFWSNHFCVNFQGTVMAGAYEREAIRPHVLGRFADMLLAAESHPAMLIYLDNAGSIGPASVAGINRDRGLNENLAREILELHTLGVRTVYAQADVTNFAKVITGWTILPTIDNPDHGGEFVFNKRMHEPAPQTLIGNTYPDTGLEQGRSVLADLARHPATARHVAVKLTRHFIADDPPPQLVETLTRRFLETDGDLKEVTKALLGAPESWAPEQAKISGRANGSWRSGAPPAGQARSPAWSAWGPCWASPCGNRPLPRVSRTTTRLGWTAWRCGSKAPTRSRSASATPSIRRRFWRPRSARLPPRRRAAPSRGPKASSRRSPLW